MDDKKYDEKMVIDDFLNYNFNPAELSLYYEGKGIIISSQTISKILNRSNLSEELKIQIKEKKRDIKYRNSVLSKEKLDKLLTKIDKELPSIVNDKMFISGNEDLLRVVYLYVTDHSYEDIKNILGFSKSSISLWINKTLDSNILTENISSIIRGKLEIASKYNNNEIKIDILRVVDTFIKNEGDYILTMLKCNISERTLTRYLSYEFLEELLGKDKYEEFIELKKHLVAEQTKLASDKSVIIENINRALDSCCENNIVIKRYKILLKYILIDEIYDIKKLMNKMKLTEETIVKYINNKDAISTLFGEYILHLLENVYDKIILSKDIKLENEINLINYYLRGRYNFFSFSEKVNKTEDYVYSLLSKKAKSYENILGEDICDRIKEHKKLVKSIYLSCPKNLVVIDAPELIEIARHDLIYVNNSQYRKLSYCALFLRYKGNLDLLCENENLNLTNIFVELNNKDTLNLLNDEANEKIKMYMYYEEIMVQGNKLSEKKELIMNIIRYFCVNKYDVTTVIESTGLPIEIIEKIVNDNLCDVLYIKEIIENIRHNVNCYYTSQKEELMGYKKK